MASIPLLLKDNLTPPTKPNFGLPCTRLPLISAINTWLAIWYSSILPNVSKPSQYSPMHYNHKLRFHSIFYTHLVILKSIHSCHSHQTFQTLHLKNIPFRSLSTSHPHAPYNAVGIITPSYSPSHYPQSYIAQHTFHLSLRITPLIHCVPHPY